MLSAIRLTFPAIALTLVFSLSCLLPARTIFSSSNLHFAEGVDDHSPAYNEGMEAFGVGNYEKAAEDFKQATVDKPKDMWAFYYLGLCFLHLKRFDEAAKAYQQARAIKPKESAVHYQLGKAYLGMGDLEAARNEHLLLQAQDQELALLLSDLFPSDKPSVEQTQEKSASSATLQPAKDDKQPSEPMTRSLRPTVTSHEKAKYTSIARTNLVQGTVVLKVVFASNSELQNIRVIHGLPDGLTRKALEAAQKLRFKPAVKNGELVSVQGSLEYTFYLY
ncbi:MAG TPA: TonB family protein [Blastocatellia bacterium]|nr:TonB family protein [Blastocatellia bacterium]